MQAQVVDHKAAVALFEQEANSGQDPLLKRYAQTYLPMLQHHLQMAESIKLSS
jgi:putative membrane protein